MLWLAPSALANPVVAVVVVDQAAREQGYALELEDLVVEDALPIDVVEGEHVRIVDPDGVRHELDVAPGEAWEVTGPQGEAWMSRLGEDVRTDLLVVRGDEDAVRALAAALHAEVRSEEGQFVLIRHDLLFDVPWAQSNGLSRVDEVQLVRVRPEDAARQPTFVARPAPSLVRRAVVAPVAAAPAAPAPVVPIARAAPANEARRTPAPATSDDGTADEPPVEAPAPEAAPAAADRTLVLDPTPYLGLYFCSDGTPLLLTSGGFGSPGNAGDWYVSAPGVVHLLGENGDLRAAIEVDRHYCRAVW